MQLRDATHHLSRNQGQRRITPAQTQPVWNTGNRESGTEGREAVSLLGFYRTRPWSHWTINMCYYFKKNDFQGNSEIIRVATPTRGLVGGVVSSYSSSSSTSKGGATTQASCRPGWPCPEPREWGWSHWVGRALAEPWGDAATWVGWGAGLKDMSYRGLDLLGACPPFFSPISPFAKAASPLRLSRPCSLSAHSVSGFTGPRLGRSFVSGLIKPVVLCTPDFGNICWGFAEASCWRELTLWGPLGWSKCNLHVTRTQIFEAARSRTLWTQYFPSKIHTWKL